MIEDALDNMKEIRIRVTRICFLKFAFVLFLDLYIFTFAFAGLNDIAWHEMVLKKCNFEWTNRVGQQQ